MIFGSPLQLVAASRLCGIAFPWAVIVGWSTVVARGRAWTPVKNTDSVGKTSFERLSRGRDVDRGRAERLLLRDACRRSQVMAQ